MAIKTITFNYTGAVQVWTPPPSAINIKIECWGGAGGRDGSAATQNGGYCTGEYILPAFVAPPTLYIYVGGVGVTGASGNGGGWNGGGNAGPAGSSGGGGGSTDVRTIGVIWDNYTSLLSRLIVAGGAGGDGNGPIGGVGGGLIGGTGNGGSGGGTQVSGGVGSNGVGSFGKGASHNGDGGGGGGGWYGGGAGNGDAGGGGGSSYFGSLVNASTTAGINNTSGKVSITYEDDTNIYLLKKDDKYYIPQKSFFDIHTKKFNSVPQEYILSNLLANYNTMKPTDLNNPFTINGEIYYPSSIIDFTKYQLCVFSLNRLRDFKKININYTPSKTALSKTDIKILDKIKTTREDILNPFIDITATSKTNINYSIKFDTGNDIVDANSTLLNAEILKSDFNLSFKLTNHISLLKSVTLYSRNIINYFKIKDDDYGITNDYINTWVTFKKAYQEVLINRITKQDFKYTNDTLEKF